ncbi:MAG: DivIVA domain-containing protein [Actinomycetota bacterium]|nr:DivIVA domain-containing protein [Actinomycetota bacterium]
MELSARDIHEKQFHDAWRGYNQEEVDDFLDRTAEVLDRVQRENQAIQSRMNELEQAVATSREAEEMLKKTLVTAQQAAEEAIAKAKAKAGQLVGEAEQRAKRANDEARERITSAENEARRKALDAEREHATRKRELDTSIERLRAFETELKQRLRTFLEQQVRGLDTLTEREPPATRQADFRTAGGVQRRPAAQQESNAESERQETPVQPSAQRAVEGRPAAEGQQGPLIREPPEEQTAEPATQQRRGVRGLFWREDG